VKTLRGVDNMANFIPSFRDFVEPNLLSATPATIINQTNDPLNAPYIPVVYGLQRVVPPRIYTRVSDLDPNTLVCVYALSEGECLGVYRLFIDDVYVQTKSSMAVNETDIPNGSTNRTITTPVSTSAYADIAEFEFLSGNEKYLFDNFSKDGYESKLLVKHITSVNDRPSYPEDFCYLVCAFKYIPNTDSPYNGVPLLTIDLFGRRIAESVNSNTSTRFFSNNPVNCLYDYLTNTTYGCGLPQTSIDGFASGSSWRVARDYSNEIVLTTVTTSEVISATRYTLNKTLDTSRDRLDNIREILKVFLMMMPYIAGKFQLRLEKTETSEVDLNEDVLVTPLRITYPDGQSRFNSILYTYSDPNLGFAPVSKIYPTNATELANYLSEDNGNQNRLELSLPGVTNPLLAERIAKTYLNKSRAQAKYQFTVFKNLFAYKVGDVIRLKVSIPNLDFLSVRIVSMRLTEDDLITVEAYSHSNAFYEPFSGFTQDKPVYRNPIVPVPGGIVIQVPDINIEINPGQENPDQILPQPAPIVPTPSPTPTPEPDYVYNVNSSYSPTTIGGANDKFPNRFYAGWISPDDRNGTVTSFKDTTDYFPGVNSNKFVLRFQDATTIGGGYYGLYLKFVDRLAINSRLSLVYSLPNGRFGICRKFANRSDPTYFIWDPERPTDYVDVIDRITGNYQLTNFSEFVNDYAFNFNLSPKRNTTPESYSQDGFYSNELESLRFYPLGAAHRTKQTFIDGIQIRHYLNPTIGKQNFVTNSSTVNITVKLFHPVQKTYFGSYTIAFGPASMTQRDGPYNVIWESQNSYYQNTYFYYPNIPF
jgi:hypothetical protein